MGTTHASKTWKSWKPTSATPMKIMKLSDACAIFTATGSIIWLNISGIPGIRTLNDQT